MVRQRLTKHREQRSDHSANLLHLRESNHDGTFIKVDGDCVVARCGEAAEWFKGEARRHLQGPCVALTTFRSLFDRSSRTLMRVRRWIIACCTLIINQWLDCHHRQTLVDLLLSFPSSFALFQVPESGGAYLKHHGSASLAGL